MLQILKNFLLNLLLCTVVSLTALFIVEWTLTTSTDRVPLLTQSSVLGWDSISHYEDLSAGGSSGPLTLFLGDSFTFQMEWPKQALELIREQIPGARGANLAVPGFGTYQELLKLRRHFDELRPSAVVLLFFSWNDVRDNFPHPGIFYNIQTRERPYWGMPEFRPRFPGFVERSKIYERFTLRVTQPALDEEKRRVGIDAFAAERRRGVFLYDDIETWAPFYDPAKQDSAYVRGAWESTEGVLAEMKRYLEEKGCPLVVIGVDNALTVDGDVYEEWVVKTGLSDHFDSGLPLRRLGEVLGRLGIRYVNALPILRTLPGKVYSGAPGHVGDYLGREGEAKLAEIAAGQVAPLVIASEAKQ